MSAFEAAEMLATGKAVVTTVEDIRTLRDRAVEEATAPLRTRLAQLEKALRRILDNSRDADCGDHCSNFCMYCNARAALALSPGDALKAKGNAE